jgi:anaerobic ribonucleoside-triphosphate reductase
MNVIKRNGEKQVFDKNKIAEAVARSLDVTEATTKFAGEVSDHIFTRVKNMTYDIPTETLDSYVIEELVKADKPNSVRQYINAHDMKSVKDPTLYKRLASLLTGKNDDILGDNSNKNPILMPTQRDYIAGELAKEIGRKTMLPKDIVEAHDKGIIHFHDLDYSPLMPETNCCLVNLADMLQNGTQISGVTIDKPRSFSTACNIATQIIAQVASSQYGGQTITLSHLAPFVDVSRQKIKARITSTIPNADAETINKLVEAELKQEIKKGVQTIQYQILTLMTTQGQTPFITVYMYIDEVPEGQLRDDLVMVIEEVIRQRTEGIKDKLGKFITPAFPKLIYVLEEDNIREDSKYWYLTELSAKCSAKRLVPDYMSEKKMKELKDGNCYPTMGCRSILPVWKEKKETITTEDINSSVDFNIDTTEETK